MKPITLTDGSTIRRDDVGRACLNDMRAIVVKREGGDHIEPKTWLNQAGRLEPSAPGNPVTQAEDGDDVYVVPFRMIYYLHALDIASRETYLELARCTGALP